MAGDSVDYMAMGGGSGVGGNDGERESSPGGGDDNANLREQDRFLPIANVGRVMKRVIPANAKISKDAKETMQECVSEFISFITGEASDKCAREKRKTINGDDILWAMSTLGFDDYIEPLKVYLLNFREVESEKVAGSRGEDEKLTNSIAGPTGMTGHPGMDMAGMHGIPAGYGEAMGNAIYMYQR